MRNSKQQFHDDVRHSNLLVDSNIDDRLEQLDSKARDSE